MARRPLMPTLADLRADVAQLREKDVSWGAAVPAPKTLPSGEVVEAWYLAGLFLRQWADSIGRSAWKRTMITGREPGAGQSTEGRAQSQFAEDVLADDISDDPSLDPLLAEHVDILAESVLSALPDTRFAGRLVRATLEAHEWCVLFAVLTDPYRRPKSADSKRGLPRLRRAVGNLGRATRELAFRLSEEQHALAADLLTNYRNQTLALSWMPYCQGDAGSQIDDPLFPSTKEIIVMRELAEKVSQEFEGIKGVHPAAVRSVVQRIAEAILQRGFKEFANDLAAPGLFAGHDLGGNGLPINVIPGNEPGQCAPLLVAVAQGGKTTGLGKIIPKVRRHLIDCNPITNAVIIVTDEWKPGILGDSLDDLKSHVAKGKKVVFLLAPQPGSSVIHMPISLR